MISQGTFVDLMHGLGDADAPPADSRLDAIHHRIRVVRVRRAVTAAAAVIAIVVAGIVVASVRPAPVPMPTAPSPSPSPSSLQADMPQSWTAADGVTYRLVKVVSLDTAHQGMTTLSVPADTPITLRYRCVGDPATTDGVPGFDLTWIRVGQSTDMDATTDRELACSTRVALADLDTAKLTRAGGDATLAIEGWPAGTSAHAVMRVHPGLWTVGVYSWSTRTAQRTPPFLPAAPDIPGYHRVTFHPVPWPRTWVTFDVPANTTWTTLLTCSDTFAGAAPNLARPGLDNAIQVSIDGKPAGGPVGFDCPTSIAPGTVPIDHAPAGKPRTIKITVTIDPIYDHRLGEILFTIYYKK
jgi:hypothetical protein